MIRSIYVASAFADYRRTRRVQRMLRAAGFEISFDWSAAADDAPGGDADVAGIERLAAAVDDARGVAQADALLLLTPEDKTMGCGCWVELGLALAMNKRIVITGAQRDRTIFCELTERRHSDEDGVALLIALASAA